MRNPKRVDPHYFTIVGIFILGLAGRTLWRYGLNWSSVLILFALVVFGGMSVAAGITIYIADWKNKQRRRSQ